MGRNQKSLEIQGLELRAVLSFMEKVEVVFRVKKEVLPGCKAAATGVRVIELVLPELLLEVQAIAVVS